MKRTLFLSYTAADIQFVERLATDCEKHGIKVFYYERDLKPGANIWSSISDEIMEKRIVAVVLSSKSAGSAGVMKEIELTYQHFGLSQDIHIVPILIEALDVKTVPEKLRGIYWADFSKSYVLGRAQLLKLFGIDANLRNDHRGKTIADSSNLYALSWQCLRYVYDVTRESYVQLILQGTERQAIQYVVVADSICDTCFRYRLVTLTGVIGQAIISGEIINIPDVEHHAGYIKAEPTTKSEMVVPIVSARYGVVGAINIEARELNGFKNIDRNDLMELAYLIGDVLETREWIPSPVGILPSYWFPQIAKRGHDIPAYSIESIARHIEGMQRTQDEWNYNIDGEALTLEDVRFFHVSERIRHARDLLALGLQGRAIALLEAAPEPWKDDRILYELKTLKKKPIIHNLANTTNSVDA